MEPIRKHRGVVAPLYRENIDTDQIIPKQHLKRIERTGFGQFLFSDWRYHPDGTRPRRLRAQSASTFARRPSWLPGKNFGCGSSREHAAWALGEFGFRVILAPSYADIFRNNAGNNGLLVIELPEAIIQRIAEHADKRIARITCHVDLEKPDDYATTSDCQRRLRSNPSAATACCNGLDEIGMTLVHEADISRFRERASNPHP